MKKSVTVIAGLMIMVLVLGTGWGALSSLHVPHPVSTFLSGTVDGWWVSDPGANPVLQVCGPDDRT